MDMRNNLSGSKGDLVPRIVQRHVGIIHDSERALCCVPPDKLDWLSSLILVVLAKGSVDIAFLEKTAEQCMNMKVAVRPASLWIHSMFLGLRTMHCSSKGMWRSQLQAPTDGGLRAELERWRDLTSCAQEGP